MKKMKKSEPEESFCTYQSNEYCFMRDRAFAFT